MEHAETVPAVLHRPEIHRALRRLGQNRRSIVPGHGAAADQHDRLACSSQHIRNGMLAGDKIAQGLRAQSSALVPVSQVRVRTDYSDFELPGTPAISPLRLQEPPLL